MNEIINKEDKRKKCGDCGKTKLIDDFHFRDKKKGIKSWDCKECSSKRSKENRLNPKPKKIKKSILEKDITEKKCNGPCGLVKKLDCFFLVSNKNYHRNKCKQCVMDQRQEKIEKKREELHNSPEYIVKKAEELHLKEENAESHKRELKDRRNKRKKERRKNDPSYRLREYLSIEINTILKYNGSGKKGRSFLTAIGCSMNDFKFHYESLFEPWMTWENQGKYDPKTWDDNDPKTWKWQQDHIIPLADLPFSSMEDENFKIAFSLSNLRPFSAKQNVLDGTSRSRHKTKRWRK